MWVWVVPLSDPLGKVCDAIAVAVVEVGKIVVKLPAWFQMLVVVFYCFVAIQEGDGRD